MQNDGTGASGRAQRGGKSMKPLKLKMKNFGPYKDAEVDFTKFSEAPLFLITGATGSGKTTIFDARKKRKSN